MSHRGGGYGHKRFRGGGPNRGGGGPNRGGGGPNRGGGGPNRGGGRGRGRGGPPPGLTGREIGMWYAQKSKHHKKEQEKNEASFLTS